MSTIRILPAGLAALLVCLGLCAGPARGEDGLWTSDFAAAKAKAKAEKKYLLVDFTGSDWCIWCKRLHAEVFSKDTFKTEAPKQFVLVELDFPHRTKLSEELQAQNEKLAKEYKITGYPTVLLLDPEGELIAQTGYKPGGPEKYMVQLGEFSAIYDGILKMKSELKGVKGLDRAKLLDQLIVAFDKLKNPADDVQVWSKEIVAIDADNKAGLRQKYECRMMLAEAEQLAACEKVRRGDCGPRKGPGDFRPHRRAKARDLLPARLVPHGRKGPGRYDGLLQEGPGSGPAGCPGAANQAHAQASRGGPGGAGVHRQESRRRRKGHRPGAGQAPGSTRSTPTPKPCPTAAARSSRRKSPRGGKRFPSSMATTRRA